MKWRLFKHFRHGGNDPEAETVYRWHIDKRSGGRLREGQATDVWKTSIEDYVDAARGLFEGMREDGFALSGAVPVDLDGELLNGAHRVACALALGVAAIPVRGELRRVWAPAWDYDWFVRNGMAPDDLVRLMQDWREMGGR